MGDAAARPAPWRRPHTGVIASFDDERGLGVVLDSTGARVPFHCTAIADGSRHIPPGTAVVFVMAPGNLGQIEARGIVPAERSAPPPR